MSRLVKHMRLKFIIHTVSFDVLMRAGFVQALVRVTNSGFLSQITRDYDEEEQGYDSEKEREDRKYSDDSALSPLSVEGNGTSRPVKGKVNGADDHHEEDMDVSD